MAQPEEKSVLQFSPFNSCVDPSFWHKLSQIKLDVDRLDETIRPIWGYYSNSDPPGLTATVNVDCSGFNSEFGAPKPTVATHGVLLNKNTIEYFKTCDKVKLLQEYGDQLWQDITSGKALDDPSLLSRFILLTFADLKKYHFYFWFAFPAPNFNTIINLEKPVVKLASLFSKPEIESLTRSYHEVSDWKQKGYFICKKSDDGVKVLSLSEIKTESEEGLYVAVADPCPLADHPGWPLRNLLALLSYQCPNLVGRTLQIISFRLALLLPGGWSCENSLVLEIVLPPLPSEVVAGTPPGGDVERCSAIKWVGWEKNERGKYGPRIANLSTSMDPIKLAEASVDLNLKLMKWRLLPELDLDIVKNSRCLLLGAGTLGCSVARNLLAWGVRQITLVDNGRVSYSNPVRQSLYTHAVCVQGGELKAIAAAKSLRDIFPGVESNGVVLNIPMPGHPIGDSLLAETQSSVGTLEELIANHDVVFLLMDSRESRWLPTMIAASKEKIVMNAALGFDTYLVMRHGTRPQGLVDGDHGLAGAAANQGATSSHKTGQPIPGDQLGCYFCNDVTAPGNSQRDRSLDMQCTVTRPGVSGIAAALVVELLISVLQHPSGAAAPAETGGEPCEPSVLGLVPHSIRGFLSQYQQVLPSCHKFNSCIACSQTVIAEYQNRGFDFLFQVFNTPHYLEDITGLTKMKAETADTEIWELSDSDSGEME